MSPDRSKCILLVDDDPNDIAIAVRALRRARVTERIETATDGEEALAQLGLDGSDRDVAFPLPDVIFLDLKMPGVDGWEVLRKIRANEHTRRIPVVVLSASRLREDVDRSYDLGANSFVTKRFERGSPGTFVEKAARYWLELNERPSRSVS